MEKHTSNFNNVHTQLLLQMQIDSNIQEMKDCLSSTQNELQTTKVTLDATQNELQATKTTLVTAQTDLQTTQNELQATQNKLKTTKMKLEQTMDELNHSKENATKKENEIKFLQENILKGVENIQKQNENGFKLNHQITESFATYCSTVEQKQDNNTLENFLKSLETKPPINQVDPIKPIEPIEINGLRLEFLKVNDLVQNLNKNPSKSYEEKYAMLLKKMENGKIHHIDDKQLIFKLNLPKNHRKLLISHHNNIALFATDNAKCVVVKNSQLVLFDNGNDENDYQIYLQIPNYNNDNFKSYLHQKIGNGEKLLLKNDHCWNEINMDEYKNPSNEVLFYVTK